MVFKNLIILFSIYWMPIYGNCQIYNDSKPRHSRRVKNDFIGIWVPYKSEFCRISAAYTKKQQKQLMKSTVVFDTNKATFFDETVALPIYKVDKEPKDYELLNCEIDESGMGIVNDSVKVLSVYSLHTINYIFIINGSELIINWNGLVIFLKKKEEAE